MNRGAFLPAVLLLSACATAHADGQELPAATPAYRAIAFEISSWGRPLGSWQVAADGTVHHTRIDGSPFGAHRVEQRAFTIDAAGYARLAAIAAGLPQPRLDRAQCKERATDLPYGTLHLTTAKGEEAVSFDTGCLDAPYKAFVGRLQSMDTLVGDWAAQHPATSTEEVGRK